MPLALVVPVPAGLPFSVKLTVLFGTGFPPDVRVADKLAVPPNVPEAGATARVVFAAPATSVKQTCTLEIDGVTDEFVVARKALYSRYLNPLNWLRLAPLVVKNVAAVPSGPTKLNGPYWLLLAATWNFTDVFAGVVAVKLSVDHCGVLPASGLLSFSDEVNVADGAKPLDMYVLNTMSRAVPALVGMIQRAPLFVDATRSPLA